MNNVTRVLIFLAAILVAPIALWLAVAAANQQEYIALARSGLLLVGLFGMLWGLLRRRLSLAAVGIAFVVLGFLSYFASSSAAAALDSIDMSWWGLEASLCRPLPPFGTWQVWHLVAVAFLVINGVLIARDIPPRRIAGANMVFLAFAILAVLIGI